MNTDRDIAGLLKAGNKAQLEKLRENNHKKDFNDVNVEYCFRRLSDERLELRDEIINGELDYKKIRREFADVANFAHMGILACDRVLNKKENNNG